ncbi:hypothetical protein PoB_005217800 [Plakobranchus ocellatus]|uniref:Uncharacterized protein n=1 Tax=Plakobranchus ocellatus TaxID=259542 RepID=A0AAV4C1A5_9GAST|nr:hypothetical protein PoB_005217800 [Plakobranchus ocellatus]
MDPSTALSILPEREVERAERKTCKRKPPPVCPSTRQVDLRWPARTLPRANHSLYTNRVVLKSEHDFEN